MAGSAGYAGQFGLKTETTWNTGVTVDKFIPFLTEGIKNDGGERMVSQGIRAGRTLPHAHKRGIPIIGGPVSTELGNTDIAVLLKHLFGAVATTGVGPYTHTYTPGELKGVSFTCQVGRPDTGGTVRARTFTGCKIPSWTISAEAGQLAKLEFDVSAAAETGATALATASYTSGWAPFDYTDGSITIAAASKKVDSWSISGAVPLRTDRKTFGGTAITEQLITGMRELGIAVTMDFEDLTEYNQFLDDTNVTLVITLDNGTETLAVTAKGYLTGESPTVGGLDVLKQPLQFVAESATSDADAITAVLTNSEASAV